MISKDDQIAALVEALRQIADIKKTHYNMSLSKSENYAVYYGAMQSIALYALLEQEAAETHNEAHLEAGGWVGDEASDDPEDRRLYREEYHMAEQQAQATEDIKE